MLTNLSKDLQAITQRSYTIINHSVRRQHSRILNGQNVVEADVALKGGRRGVCFPAYINTKLDDRNFGGFDGVYSAITRFVLESFLDLLFKK